MLFPSNSHFFVEGVALSEHERVVIELTDSYVRCDLSRPLTREEQLELETARSVLVRSSTGDRPLRRGGRALGVAENGRDP
jgi:hypothetical protein